MKAIFENAYVYTIESLTERQKKEPASLIILVFILLLYSAEMLTMYRDAFFVSHFIQIFTVCFFAFLIIFTLLYLPKKTAKTIYQRNLVCYKTQPYMIVRFFDEHLEIYNDSSKEQLSFLYNQIIQIKETKNLYLLRIPKQVVFMVQKQSFVTGQPADFVPFLKQKCPGAARRL